MMADHISRNIVGPDGTEPVSDAFLGADLVSSSQIPEAGAPANTDDWFQSSGEPMGNALPPRISPFISRPPSVPPSPA
jgi:hypothetical protein